MLQVLPPKTEKDARLGWPCAQCGEPFEVGQITAAVGDEPADPVEAERAQRGMPFFPRAKEVHLACVGEWIRSQRRERAARR